MGKKVVGMGIAVVAIAAIVFVMFGTQGQKQAEIKNQTVVPPVPPAPPVPPEPPVLPLPPVQPERTLPYEEYCNYTETGWVCTLEGLGCQVDATNCAGLIENITQECGRQGGIFSCTGMCLEFYPRYCNFPFADGGKQCSNSEGCMADCVASLEDMEKYMDEDREDFRYGQTVPCNGTCVGTCSDTPHDICDWWVEVSNNTFIDHRGVLCD